MKNSGSDECLKVAKKNNDFSWFPVFFYVSGEPSQINVRVQFRVRFTFKLFNDNLI